jgi:hypothetical protein
LVSALPLLLLLWNYLGLRHPLSQLAPQAEFFAWHSRGYYPAQLITWPGHSLLLGLADKNVFLLKKIYVLLHLGLAALLVKGLAGEAAGSDRSGYARPFLAIAVTYISFILMLGGAFGFCCIERYLTQINPIFAWGLFHRRSLKRQWILVLAVIGTATGIFLGRSTFK